MMSESNQISSNFLFNHSISNNDNNHEDDQIITPKKPVRDSKRRATHSQIERRRREKINDRLVTLRTIVPACAAEIENRKRIKREEEEEVRKIASGEISASSLRGGKRKRNRRRIAAAKKESDGTNGGGTSGDKEEELGLHKLEVLTHTIDYIYELQSRLFELETGIKSEKRRTIDEDEEKQEGRGLMKSQLENIKQKYDLMDEDGNDKDEEDEEEEDDDDEAHLEMSEWKGIQSDFKRDLSGSISEIKRVDPRRPTFTRRSTISSDISTNLSNSPIIVGLTAESPLFSSSTTTTNSSISNYTTLTSPMMSLSAGSPILRWHNQDSNNSVPFLSGGKKRENSVNGKSVNSKRKSQTIDLSSSSENKFNPTSIQARDDNWRLPSPVFPFNESLSNLKKEKYNPTSSFKSSKSEILNQNQVNNNSNDNQHHDDAHLLLAFSHSPEVLRPISAIRQTSDQRISNQRRSSFTPSIHQRRKSVSPTSISFNQSKDQSIIINERKDGLMKLLRTSKTINGRSIVLDSAPGGAHPSSSLISLPSPPLFALDEVEDPTSTTNPITNNL